jgi:hypothetical protein
MIGAGIALVSSLLTAVVTALINYWIFARQAESTRKERAANLLGRTLALIDHNPEAARVLLGIDDDEKRIMDTYKEHKNNQADAMIGVFEGHIEALLQKLKQKDSK